MAHIIGVENYNQYACHISLLSHTTDISFFFQIENNQDDFIRSNNTMSKCDTNSFKCNSTTVYYNNLLNRSFIFIHFINPQRYYKDLRYFDLFITIV